MATDYLKLSKEAFEASTSYIDANYRDDWDYSLRAFRNEHAAGSKYLSEEYKARSRLFRPKTRSIIRKNEAAAMASRWNNMDTVNLLPGNPDDMMSVASCAALKEVVEYRLTRTIPAFQIYLGGVQDAQTTGTVCSYQYWKYEKRNGKKIKDQPCIELRPVENIRLDAGADWLDPVGTSPYFCDIIPMYVCDVRAMMKNKDDKTGAPKWKSFKDDVIAKARPDRLDTLRQSRLGGKMDPHMENSEIKSFDVVWVLRWFMRDSQGDDQTYYTLGTEELLTDAKPIEEVYFHGKRPYVIGYAVLETHKALKTGLSMLVRPLQQESNNLANTRMDNVHFVLYKRWLVARGRQVDVPSLVRGVPGAVTLMTDPNTDVKESNWADVTSSAYVEQDRLNSDFDQLAGNFDPSTKVANNAVNDTLGGSRMANQSAGMMTDYLLRTIDETWWEPVLRQLVLLEQYYETDEIVLGVAANKAQLFPRFGISRITDMMLMAEVHVNVNSASGSPNERFTKFIAATNAAIQIRVQAPPGANVEEMTKEIYANAGYRDGARFFNDKADPRLVKAMQMIQQMQGLLQGKQLELQAQGQIEQAKITSNERIKSSEIKVNYERIQGDLRIREAELAVQREELELERIKIGVEMNGAVEEHRLKLAQLGAKLDEQAVKLQGERERIAHEKEQAQADLAKSALELVSAQASVQNEQKVGKMASDMDSKMQGMGAEMARISAALDKVQSMRTEIDAITKGVGSLARTVMTPKKKARAITLKKDGKKTSGIVVGYDDGSSDEVAVR